MWSNDNNGTVKTTGSYQPNVLDSEQIATFNMMEKSNNNIFITGKAGTGKSFLLDVFKHGTHKKTLTVAPTGIAALNVGGATIHSTFGYKNLENISLDELTVFNLFLNEKKKRVLKEIDTLIIDEISMVRADIFDKIEKILKIVNNSEKPFGGKQVIVFGDLFQLPPIPPTETNLLTQYAGNFFFFNSDAYKKGNFRFIELSINHRQDSDPHFFEILNKIREGCFDGSDLEHLNCRFISNKQDLRRVMTLFPTKAQAEKLNKEELSKIEAREYVYKSKITFNAKKTLETHLESNFPISNELHLKRGALVMMVANDLEKRWVNGTLGVVQSLTENSIKVTINGITYDINKMIFSQKEAIFEDGKIIYKDILEIEQYPIVLAYAITIHKSQGMTYKKLACDISQCFAPGQAYVALSRCSNLDGLYLLSKINASGIYTDKNVVEFYKQHSIPPAVKKI